MTPSPGIEPGPNWWETSGLTSAFATVHATWIQLLRHSGALSTPYTSAFKNKTVSFVLPLNTRHLQHTGHMKSFVLVSEEAISKGIRRIVALTGPEALKAEKKCNSLEEHVEKIQNLVQKKMKEGGLKIKETSQEIARLTEVRTNTVSGQSL